MIWILLNIYILHCQQPSVMFGDGLKLQASTDLFLDSPRRDQSLPRELLVIPFDRMLKFFLKVIFF